MYRVYWDSFLLHDLMIPEEEGYYLKSPTLTEEINKVAEFTFDIYPNHPAFDKLEKLVPNIILEKDGRILFKGRIIKEKQNMDNSKQVTCESVLAFLLDSIQRPFEFQGTPAELFTQFINNHNEQVEEYKRFKIGKTTGSNLDNNEYVNRSSEEYLNTYEAIESRLLNIGGYLLVRYEDDGNYIDWVDDFGESGGIYVSNQKIEFGENLIDILVENDASETYTVVIPLGVEFEEVTNEETGEVTPKHRLTIKEINDGKDYLVNEEAVKKYGWIVAPISETTWDDVTIASNLLRKGAEYLNSQAIMMKSTLELNAIDLNVVDKDISSFKMGEYIEVVSTPHGISKKYLLTKKVTPISNPENMSVTLGETEKTFTGLEFEDKNEIEKDVLEKVESTLKDYVTNENMGTIIDEKIENNSIIKQLPDQIMSEVSQTYTSKVEFEKAIDNIELKTLYTWIKYADDDKGTNMSNSSVGKEYIGIAFNKETETASNNPSDYAWTKIQGVDGKDGKDGSNGSDGRGISSTKVEYQVSSNGTTVPTGTWGTTIPTLSANQYLWTRTTITYTDNTTSVSYSIGRSGSNGADGKNGTDGKNGSDGR